jgi:hypothetical protein
MPLHLLSSRGKVSRASPSATRRRNEQFTHRRSKKSPSPREAEADANTATAIEIVVATVTGDVQAEAEREDIIDDSRIIIRTSAQKVKY